MLGEASDDSFYYPWRWAQDAHPHLGWGPAPNRECTSSENSESLWKSTEPQFSGTFTQICLFCIVSFNLYLARDLNLMWLICLGGQFIFLRGSTTTRDPFLYSDHCPPTLWENIIRNIFLVSQLDFNHWSTTLMFLSALCRVCHGIFRVHVCNSKDMENKVHICKSQHHTSSHRITILSQLWYLISD